MSKLDELIRQYQKDYILPPLKRQIEDSSEPSLWDAFLAWLNSKTGISMGEGFTSFILSLLLIGIILAIIVGVYNLIKLGIQHYRKKNAPMIVDIDSENDPLQPLISEIQESYQAGNYSKWCRLLWLRYLQKQDTSLSFTPLEVEIKFQLIEPQQRKLLDRAMFKGASPQMVEEIKRILSAS